MRKKKSALRRRKLPERSELRGISDAIRRLPNVIGCFVGHRTTGGKRTKQLACVCLVSRKVPTSKLAPDQVIPRRAEWTERGATRSLRTDVIQFRGRFRYQANVLGPGDGLSAGENGSVGAALEHKTLGRCITTARHVVDPPGQGGTVTVTSGGAAFTGRVVRVGTAADYALVTPSVGVDCDNLWQDQYRIGPAYVPSEHDVGEPLFALAAGGERGPLACEGVFVDLEIPGGPSFRNVIVTSAGTYAGDSGCCLVDQYSRVWGFLLGRLGNLYSVFLPAVTVLSLEEASIR